MGAREFFAELRLMLALDPSRTVLGDVVLDAINTRIIPKIQKEIDSESDAGKQEELDRLINLWSVYGDKRTAEGRSWNNEGAKTVGAVAAKLGRSQSDAEDMASEIAAKFYTENRLRTLFDRYKIETGPLGLMHLWKKVLRDEATLTWTREYEKHTKEHDRFDDPSEDGHSLSERIPDSKVPFDEAFIENAMAKMDRYMETHLSNDAEKLLYKLWRQAKENNELEKVNWSRDVYPAWSDATGLSMNRMQDFKDEVMDAIKRFLKEKTELDLSSRQWSQLKLSSRVAADFMWRRFAGWMLAGVR